MTKTITLEQYKKLDSLLPNLHSLQQALEGAVHPDHIKLIKKMMEDVSFALNDIHQAEEDDFEENCDRLAEIQEQNGFSTIWSVSEVKAGMMGEKMPFKIGTIVYESWGPTQTRVVNQNLTWLEAWKLADELIRASGDTHHVFIEGFAVEGHDKSVVSLHTGS